MLTQPLPTYQWQPHLWVQQQRVDRCMHPPPPPPPPPTTNLPMATSPSVGKTADCGLMILIASSRSLTPSCVLITSVSSTMLVFLSSSVILLLLESSWEGIKYQDSSHPVTAECYWIVGCMIINVTTRCPLAALGNNMNFLWEKSRWEPRTDEVSKTHPQ